MTSITWLSVLVASLAGSVHCAAMCGGFVAAYAGGEGHGPLRRTAAHVAYNGGRLVTYLGLGALAGALGRSLDLFGNALGVAHAAAVVTGVVLILGALASLRPRLGLGLTRLGVGPSRRWASRLTPLFQRYRAQPAVVRALLLGLSSTLLPCGWLYAFVALAAGTGGALSGAWLMSAFWLGSVPLLLGLGVSLHGVARPIARILPRLRPVLLLGVGAFTLVSRLSAPAPALAASPHDAVGTLPMPADCPHHRHLQAPAPLPPAFGGSKESPR